MLTMRYICHVRKRRATDESIWEEVLDQFAKHDNIDFAYPTTRYYNNLSEGKEEQNPNRNLNYTNALSLPESRTNKHDDIESSVISLI